MVPEKLLKLSVFRPIAIRCTLGAKNVVLVGGIDWSYDLSGILAGRELSDPQGNGVIYANHAYPNKGDTVEKWVAKMEAATQKLAVNISEFGSDPAGARGVSGEQWVRQVLQAMHDHDWDWMAWDLHAEARPKLISDWKYTPTPTFGKWVKLALTGTLPPYTPPPAKPASPTKPAPANVPAKESAIKAYSTATSTWVPSYIRENSSSIRSL